MDEERADFLPRKRNSYDFKNIKYDTNESFYVRSIFMVFTVIWMIIIIMGKFYESLAAWILLIPFGIFLLGFMFADETCDHEVHDDVFSVTFIAIGVVVAIPLLTFANKEKPNVKINHIIFLAIIATLLSYLHLWVNKTNRYICKVVRSCLETYAITLYIFAIMILFIDEK